VRAGADLTGNWASRAVRRLGMRLRILAFLGVRPAVRLNEGAGELAARVVFSRYESETGLRLVDTLLEVGSESESEPVSREHGTRMDGDALARAVVERAVLSPAPLALESGGSPGNGVHGHSNGNGVPRGPVTGYIDDGELAERAPAEAVEV
jgi:hypothetical protein